MTSFSELPVLEVNIDNYRQIWPAITAAVKSATFIALDCELSGLGERKQLNAKDIGIRYEGMKTTAKTRSIISFGLSCFKALPTIQPRSEHDNRPIKKSISFMVQTFNILVLCSENYTVEPLSLKFLLEHGFDFNKQYAKGMPYYRGADKPDDKEGQSLRQLFTEIVRSRVPIVLHNAPVDLMFMYHSFYGSLPSSMEIFLADLSEMLSGGVYDTKYMAEFKARFSASYLEYVFRKCQRQNASHESAGLSHTKLLFPPYPRSAPHVVWMPCGLHRGQHEHSSNKPCRDFGAHGWCAKKKACPYSHDIDVILDKEEAITAKKNNKRKRRKTDPAAASNDSKNGSEDNDGGESSEDSDQAETNKAGDADIASSVKAAPPPVFQIGGHRAGFDAFMTGMAFAAFIAKYGTYDDIDEDLPLLQFGMEEFVNKVTLTGKDIPLQISKSAFSKTSKEHREKIQRIRIATRTDEAQK